MLLAAIRSPYASPIAGRRGKRSVDQETGTQEVTHSRSGLRTLSQRLTSYRTLDEESASPRICEPDRGLHACIVLVSVHRVREGQEKEPCF